MTHDHDQRATAPVRIVYNSFEGRYSDSPRVLHETLLARGGDHEHVWVADPGHVAGFPAGTVTVPAGSAACVEALEACDLLVANTHTEVDWRKAPDATYLQTWHGTPLKRIHHDVLWAPEGRLAWLDRDIARWDVLLSPNHASTPLLRAAFRYDGEVLESGYPRNDVLLGADRDDVRARVRKELDVADDVVLVLYAPTWRDDAVLTTSGDVPLGLDVEATARALGPGFCIAQRLHYFATERRPAVTGDGLRDVSRWPDIAELYLAADVCITDYSSVMFDWALTDKPLLFHVHDLADYGSRVRGFYVDLAPIAPGPLLTTDAEVVDALRHLDDVGAAHREAYARFRATYGHLEDGHATERVLTRLRLS